MLTNKEIAEWLRESAHGEFVVTSKGTVLGRKKWHKRAAQVEAMGPTTAEWRAELDKVMPPDFKDWWENAESDLPAVAAMVIQGLRERLAEAEAQLLAVADRRCLNCKWWADTYNCDNWGIEFNRVSDCGPNFCCIHWERR